MGEITLALNKLLLFAGMRGSTPLDVAAASCIDNNELALALQEQDLEMVKYIEHVQSNHNVSLFTF